MTQKRKRLDILCALLFRVLNYEEDGTDFWKRLLRLLDFLKHMTNSVLYLIGAYTRDK